jgi:cytosine/adenosine deaminase-related metal-dependent hydrolase
LEKYSIKNAWICRINEFNIQPIFGDMVIENGKISKISPTSFENFVNSDNHSNGIDEIDVAGRVITIPQINFHDHFYSRLAKGLPIAGPTDNFENILKNLWWKLDMALDQEMIKASVQMSILEAIKNGVTTIFDHHASPAHTTGSLSIIADTMEQANLRGVLCFETSDRNGQSLSQQAIDENKNFMVDRCNDNIKAMFGLHASFTVEDATLQAAAEIIKDLTAGIHIHLSEDPADRQLSLQKYGLEPVARLEKFSLMNDLTILSHAIHTNQTEYDIIARYGAAIAINLDSNLNNQVGIPDFSIINSEIPLLLGTDGMHDNMARALKQAFLLHRYQGNGFEITFPWVEKIFKDQLNFAKKYFPDLSHLQEGDPADFILWDYVPAAPFSEDNFWGHYLYGILERPVKSVVQSGKFLMKDYKILVMDEDAVNKNIYQQGERLLKAFSP